MSETCGCCGTGKQGTGSVPADSEKVVEMVRGRYADIALGETVIGAPTSTGCCGPDAGTVAEGIGYTNQDLDQLPVGTNLGLGCGAPVAHLHLQQGETVLDLGSGAGIDVFLAAREVGPNGRVIGVDMTPEMIERATANAAELGLTQVEFVLGRLESLPVEDGSVDAVTSNCVINLVPDKAAVFREVARVLRPGGRLVISDIVLESPLPDVVAADIESYVGCVAGAQVRSTYFGQLEDAGLRVAEVIKDVDYLAAASMALPDEIAGLLERSGIEASDLVGQVRSVTFRAVRD